MNTPVSEYLDEILDGVREHDGGDVADYIPELAEADPERLGVCLSTTDGVIYGAGDIDVEFTLQSISKPFAYALALAEHGRDAVLARVGVEPSGEAFNELSLERGSGRPLNPMINAGALTTHSLIGPAGSSPEHRVELFRDGLSRFVGRRLEIDEKVLASELDSAYRNLALANMLRSYGIVEDAPHEIVEGYTAQCAVKVTLRDLATMAATLANRGIQPATGERVLSAPVVRQVLSVMMTCGMYDAAGDWMSTIGFPAKSGVSGGILGLLPGQVGIATFSPRLDEHGNSVRGVALCRRMSDDMGMHIMAGVSPARSVIRRDRVLRAPGGRHVRICSLQGMIEFSGAELVLRELSAQEEPLSRVVLDLRRVTGVNDVARRMLREALRRLRLDDLDVTLVDPGDMLGEVSDDLPDLEPGVQEADDLTQFSDHRRV